VDRLYSRFPAGSVGVALLALRLVDALGLVGAGMHQLARVAGEPQAASVPLLGLVLAASAVMLSLGLQTSWAGAAAALCTAGAALQGGRQLDLAGRALDPWIFLCVFVAFLSGALVLLGPGGYSLDARLSGWRRIDLPSRQPRPRDEE